MKPKKFLTALFYSAQTPFGVWAGVEFAVGAWWWAWGLIAVMMVLEGAAVYFWMDAQTEQTVDGLRQNPAGASTGTAPRESPGGEGGGA